MFLLPVEAAIDGTQVVASLQLKFSSFPGFLPLMPLYERVTLRSLSAVYRPTVAVAHDGVLAYYFDPSGEDASYQTSRYEVLCATTGNANGPIWRAGKRASVKVTPALSNSVTTSNLLTGPCAFTDISTTSKVRLIFATSSYQGNSSGPHAVVGHLFVKCTALFEVRKQPPTTAPGVEELFPEEDEEEQAVLPAVPFTTSINPAQAVTASQSTGPVEGSGN